MSIRGLNNIWDAIDLPPRPEPEPVEEPTKDSSEQDSPKEMVLKIDISGSQKPTDGYDDARIRIISLGEFLKHIPYNIEKDAVLTVSKDYMDMLDKYFGKIEER